MHCGRALEFTSYLGTCPLVRVAAGQGGWHEGCTPEPAFTTTPGRPAAVERAASLARCTAFFLCAAPAARLPSPPPSRKSSPPSPNLFFPKAELGLPRHVRQKKAPRWRGTGAGLQGLALRAAGERPGGRTVPEPSPTRPAAAAAESAAESARRARVRQRFTPRPERWVRRAGSRAKRGARAGKRCRGGSSAWHHRRPLPPPARGWRKRPASQPACEVPAEQLVYLAAGLGRGRSACGGGEPGRRSPREGSAAGTRGSPPLQVGLPC